MLRSEELAEESTQVVDGTSAQGHNAPKVATPEGKAKENNEDPEDAHPGPPKLSTSHKPRNIFEDIMMDEAFHEERLRVQREMKLKKRKQQQQQQNILAMKAK